MNVKKMLFGFAFLLATITSQASVTKSEEAFSSHVSSDETKTSLFFYVPEDVASVYIHISDETKHVFQKVKVYQRGNGYIVCDKTDLTSGTYFYTMLVNGKKVDTKELFVKK